MVAVRKDLEITRVIRRARQRRDFSRDGRAPAPWAQSPATRDPGNPPWPPCRPASRPGSPPPATATRRRINSFDLLFCLGARPKSICQEAKANQEVRIQDCIPLPSRNNASRLSGEGHLSMSQSLMTGQSTPAVLRCDLQSWEQGCDSKSCNQSEETVLECRRPSFCFFVL